MPGTSQTGGDICERQRAEIAGQVVSGKLSIQDACARHELSPELLLDWVAAFRQASLIAFDEQVRRTLAEQGVDVSTLASAEFQGDLGEFTIADLIQTLTLGDRDGIITVSHDARESRIWCAGGEIIDAESGRLSGVPAVHRMLGLEQGRVRASFHRVHRARRVHVSTMELLLEGARRGDECQVLRRRLGAGPYRASARADARDPSATAGEAMLLCQFLAAHSVADALAASESGDLETLTDLARLVERGWLVPCPDAGSSLPVPARSSPPVVMSFARFPTQPATPRARRRWALGAGLLVLALLTVPRYLLASRAHQPGPPAQATSTSHTHVHASPAAAQAGARESKTEELPGAPGAERERIAADGRALQPLAAPLLQTTPGAEAALAPAEMARSSPATTRARRRAPRASTAAAAAATAEVAAGGPTTPASSADARKAWSAPPRMQLIETHRPQMQILE